jgi:hypothetical protein
MSEPIIVDLPHKLGAEEARRRIAGNIDSLRASLPSGAQVSSTWEGDRLKLRIVALGQTIDAGIEAKEAVVHVVVLLPPALAMFANPITRRLAKSGPALLRGPEGS